MRRRMFFDENIQESSFQYISIKKSAWLFQSMTHIYMGNYMENSHFFQTASILKLLQLGGPKLGSIRTSRVPDQMVPTIQSEGFCERCRVRSVDKWLNHDSQWLING